MISNKYNHFSILSFLCLFSFSSLASDPTINEVKEAGQQSPSSPQVDSRYSILIVEEGASSLGIYNSEGKEVGRVGLAFLPHEIAVSADKKTAYVPNFGLRDYDLSNGYAGNSISVIDLEHQCEIDRLYTTLESTGQKFWAPHGVKIHPSQNKLYVNVECVLDRHPDLHAPLGQQTQILVFDLDKSKSTDPRVLPSFDPNKFIPPVKPPQRSREWMDLGIPVMPGISVGSSQAYSVLSGTHNFVFSPLKGHENDLWYYAGLNGVACVDANTGNVKVHYSVRATGKDTLRGPVRGLAFSEDGKKLLVSSFNEVAVIDPLEFNPDRKEIKWRANPLGVGQTFYAKFTPNTKYILAPAPRDNQVLVISYDTGNVVKRLVTGLDPLQVMIHANSAFVTNASSPWISEIELEHFTERRKIYTHKGATAQGGPNGLGFGGYITPCKKEKMFFGACLPFTGEYTAEGHECRLGLQFWQNAINSAGGIVFNGQCYEVEIVYADTESKTDPKFLKTLLDEFTDNTQPQAKPNKVTCLFNEFTSKDKLQAMFGTYPSRANLPIAEAMKEKLPGIPFITATGREPSLFDKGWNHVFGIAPVRTSDLAGTIKAISKHVSSNPRTAMILSCDEPDSIAEAEALVNYAKENNIDLLSRSNVDKYIKYDHKNSDLHRADIHELILKLNQKAEEQSKYYPDLLLVVGHRKESAHIVKACADCDFKPGALALNAGLTSPSFIAQATAVENLFGSVCWADTCSSDFAHDRFVASSDFQRIVFSIYGEKPSELVAGFAASGIVMEEALREANGTKNEPIDVMHQDGFTFDTFYGPIKFDERGVNIRKEMITIELRPTNGTLTPVPMWPPGVAKKEKPTWPFPGW